MNCPLCQTREVTERAALACHRKGYRLVCSYCLTEALRPLRPKPWPAPTMAEPVRFYSIAEVKTEAKAA